jgi:hypothetical protein
MNVEQLVEWELAGETEVLEQPRFCMNFFIFHIHTTCPVQFIILDWAVITMEGRIYEVLQYIILFTLLYANPHSKIPMLSLALDSHTAAVGSLSLGRGVEFPTHTKQEIHHSFVCCDLYVCGGHAGRLGTAWRQVQLLVYVIHCCFHPLFWLCHVFTRSINCPNLVLCSIWTCIQDYFVHRPVFSRTREHSVTETGSVSVLRWGGDTYSFGSLRKS